MAMAGRLTLGLYNSYDPRRFLEAHRRALARAAALALAFDANLATFGFPYDDLAAHGGRTAENRAKGGGKRGQGGDAAEENAGAPDLTTPQGIARYVAGTTSVASGVAPLVQLADGGRFATFEYPKKGFPPQLGSLVLTTEHATGPTATTAPGIAHELARGRSQLVLFGLGPQGTPAELRAIAAHEFDVTGRGAGLETATALGAVVAAIASHRDIIETRG